MRRRPFKWACGCQKLRDQRLLREGTSVDSVRVVRDYVGETEREILGGEGPSPRSDDGERRLRRMAGMRRYMR